MVSESGATRIFAASQLRLKFHCSYMVMTLDELIAASVELRPQVGGDAPVYLITPGGYASVLLTDSLGRRCLFDRGHGLGPSS